MCNINIKLVEQISCNKGITSEEAEPLYSAEIEAFNAGKTITLDFAGVEMITTAFLNVIVGRLYKDYDKEQLKEMLFFEGLTESIARRIKKVTDNAKLFYQDEQSYEKEVKESIDETR